MIQLERLRQRREEITAIADRYNVDELYVSGTCTREEESDIELLAVFRKGASLFDQIELEFQLSDLLGRHVDIVSMRGLKDDYFGHMARKDMTPL